MQTRKEYTWYILSIFLFLEKVYDWNIPGIYLEYSMLFIYQVYTRYIPVIYDRLSYDWYIPGIYPGFSISGDSRWYRNAQTKIFILNTGK